MTHQRSDALFLLEEIELGISAYEKEHEHKRFADNCNGMYIPINVVRRLITVRKEKAVAQQAPALYPICHVCTSGQEPFCIGCERLKPHNAALIAQAPEDVLKELIEHFEKVIKGGCGVTYNHPITYRWMYQGIVVDYLKSLRSPGQEQDYPSCFGTITSKDSCFRMPKCKHKIKCKERAEERE